MEPVELWILDRMDEPLDCPSCAVDLAETLLDVCHKLNKQRRWRHRVTIKCPFCKKLVAFDVEWIPEYATAKAVEV